VALDGFGVVAMQDDLDLLHLGMLAARSFWDAEAVQKRFESMYVPSTIFHAVHGGLAEVACAPEQGDPRLPEGARPYFDHALEQGHFPLAPPRDAPPPEVVFSFCGNVLRHTRRGERVRDTLFADAKLVVALDFRMSQTARYADIVLPAAGWYEKVGIKYIASFVPYVTLGDRAVSPRGESRAEWKVFSKLAARVAAEARRRGLKEVLDFHGDPCRLDRLEERFSDGGRFGPDAEEEVTSFILSLSSATRGVGLENLREEGGAVRIRSLGPEGGLAGVYSEYHLDEPVVPLRDMVERKRPYPTLSGRQQFYVDHPWFLKLGEELPTHKAPPASGGRHPFVLTGAHTRWSIHSMWRDHDLMLRLQRGEPLVLLNVREASARGIADHDRIRVWNDLDAFVARAKPSPAVQPGQAHIFHAWEPFQFEGGKSHQALAPSPFKVTQLVGDYGQLHWGYAHYEPNQVDRDVRVDVEKLDEQEREAS